MADRVGLVITNLLTNTIEYNRKGAVRERRRATLPGPIVANIGIPKARRPFMARWRSRAQRSEHFTEKM